MTKKNSKFINIKKYFSIPAFIGLALLFTEKVYANETDSIILKNNQANFKNIQDQDFTYPDFPGGINAFRTMFSKKFDPYVFSIPEKGTIKTTVHLTIEKDGSVSNIFATGDNEQFNAEAVRTAKKISKNTKWIPATKNGEPVVYVFRLPLTMSF